MSYRGASPALIINNLRKDHGEEWLLRLVQAIVQFKRTSEQIAGDLGVCKGHVDHLRQTLFDRLRVGKDIMYAARPIVREQLNAWEENRRKRYEDLLDIERAIATLSGDPGRMKLYTDAIAIENSPGLSRAMNETRSKMGEKDFRTFLHWLRSGKTVFEIEDRFKRYGIRHQSVALWRKTLTRPTRALIADLAVLMSAPLELVAPAGKKRMPKSPLPSPKVRTLRKASAGS